MKKRRNEHYDIEESIRWFQKALNGNLKGRARLYALKPLCRIYLIGDRYNQCFAMCAQIQKIDPRDAEAPVLRLEAIRRQVMKKRNIPCGKPCDYGWLKEASGDEIADATEHLLSQMTEGQRFFIEAIGCGPKHWMPNAWSITYPAAYNVLYNRYIPMGLLKRLRVDTDQLKGMRKIQDIKEYLTAKL